MHRANRRMWLRCAYGYCASYEILEHEDAQIELIEEDEFGDTEAVRERERYWVGRLQTVNIRNPAQTMDEHIQQLAERYRRRNSVKEPCPLCGRVGIKKHHKRHMQLVHPDIRS